MTENEENLTTTHSPLPTEVAERCFFRASAEDFKKIPGSPIAYWLNDKIRKAFSFTKIEDVSKPRKGLVTLNDSYFLRQWHEIALEKSTCHGVAVHSPTWFPIHKGGVVRKWYGNNHTVILWENDGEELKSFIERKYNGGSYTKEIRSEDFYLRQSITWSGIAGDIPSFRYGSKGFIFSSSGPCLFAESDELFLLLAYLNSSVSIKYLSIISPNLSLLSGHIAKLPYKKPDRFDAANTQNLIDIAKHDWDSYETSWDFTTLPILRDEFSFQALEESYNALSKHWKEQTLEMQRLEEENNRIFIEAYGLEDEITPDVPLEEITLSCNPYYRYGRREVASGQGLVASGEWPMDEELEAKLRADTMREFVSYAVGCMFGRYSLDKPGLILANQGDAVADYLEHVPNPTFSPDDDNVIPILGGNWFSDDIAERFKEFLRVAFGDERYEENLRFVEEALGKDIRKYFLINFYTDHVKRYKKRPIYWMFSSPKGSFNALIYMHRYRPDTVSVVLNDYLREFRSKLEAHKDRLRALSVSANASQREKTKALKDVEKVNKQIAEIDEYEREVLYPLATKRIEIDLDDGVKANYPKFGQALKKVTGLSGK